MRKKVQGIYAITLILDGRTYIGSSNRCEDRMYKHLWQLRKGKHGNPHLQAAFFKYGEGNFHFEIVETVEDKIWLLARERAWIIRVKSSEANFGFNVFDDPWFTDKPVYVRNSYVQIKAKTYNLLSPKGLLVQITNLKEFCKQNELHYPKMCEAANGIWPYRGWIKFGYEHILLQQQNDLSEARRRATIERYTDPKQRELQSKRQKMAQPIRRERERQVKSNS
jgi:hypothetical protein